MVRSSLIERLRRKKKDNKKEGESFSIERRAVKSTFAFGFCPPCIRSNRSIRSI